MKEVTIAGLLLAGTSTLTLAETVQLSVFGVQIEQEIVVTGTGFPGFSPDGGITYPFFDEYIRILEDEADLFDPSVIPTSPLTASTVINGGTALLNGTWTFDASVLAQDLTGFVDPNGTLLGTSSNVSNFSATRNGESVGSAVTTTTEVLVANDLVVGTQGEKLDLLALVAGRTPGFDGSDSSIPGTAGITLIVSGGENWFETARDAGTIPDLTSIVAGAVEEESFVFSNQNEPLFEQFIEGDLTGANISVPTFFGAADGSSEDSPLLPDANTVTEDENGDPLPAPVFSFDVAGAEVVEVQGVDIVFIDPEIAVGYTYELVGPGQIDGILAPTLAAVNDADGYTVMLPDGTTFDIDPGEYVPFATPVTSLVLTGISSELMLDPADSTTFVAGFAFSGLDSADSRFTQTAITEMHGEDSLAPVPLPASMALLLGGLACIGGLNRRKRMA